MTTPKKLPIEVPKINPIIYWADIITKLITRFPLDAFYYPEGIISSKIQDLKPNYCGTQTLQVASVLE